MPAKPRSRRARHHRVHQRAPGAVVLHRGIDRDRPHAADRVALVEEIAADDPAVRLGHHVEGLGAGDHAGSEARPPSPALGMSGGKLCASAMALKAR